MDKIMYLEILIFAALLYEAGTSRLNALNFAIKKNCSIIRTYKVQKQPLIQYDYPERPSTDGKLNIQNKFKVEEIEVNRTQPICCDGYQNYDEQSCIPVCSKSCGNRGICSAPEVCSCDEGYIMDQDVHECKPVCDLTCDVGSCIAPNVCSCEEGYRWSQEEAGWSFDEPDCKPICNNCAMEETCIKPHVCTCKQGYVRRVMNRPENLDMPECNPVCDEPCVNSECIAPNKCECRENYTRINAFTCDVRMYVSFDFAVTKNCTETILGKKKETRIEDISYYDEHTKRYTTDTDYKIELVLVNKTEFICCDGYQNFDDEKCIPVCSRNCGIHGICSAPNVCTCHEGYIIDKNFQECK